MPTAGLTFRSGPAMVNFDRWGRLTSVVHDDRPDIDYLHGMVVDHLTLTIGDRNDGLEWALCEPQIRTDMDEVEFEYAVGHRLSLVIRHSFNAGWAIRMALSNVTAAPVVVSSAHWSFVLGPAVVGWGLAAGADASYSLHPQDGAGPVLGGVLRLGSARRAEDDGLDISPVRLRPGARFVVQWLWDWYPTPMAFGQDRHPDVPETTVQLVGEPVTLTLDPDVAVIVPRGVDVLEDQDQRDLVAHQPGRHLIDLHSARGQTTLALEWVAPVPECLAVATAVALSRPRTGAHVIKLSQIYEALVVQDALVRDAGGGAGVDDAEEAGEALDLFTARLDRNRVLEPVVARYLCGEYARTGDPDLLTAAADALLTQSSVQPGLGLAVAQVSLAAMLAGQPIEKLLGHAQSLLTAHTPPARTPHTATMAVGTQVAELAALVELAAVLLTPGFARSRSRPGGFDLVRSVASLGLHLGAGLRGHAVHPLPVDELSHLVAVFHLLPEHINASLEPIWGRTAHALARAAVPAVLAALMAGVEAPTGVGPAHGWLIALGGPQ